MFSSQAGFASLIKPGPWFASPNRPTVSPAVSVLAPDAITKVPLS